MTAGDADDLYAVNALLLTKLMPSFPLSLCPLTLRPSPPPLLNPQIPPGFALPAPIPLSGTVVTGFGRGSRDLAVPTANIDPAPLQGLLATMPRGVYFGWAQLDPPGGSPPEDGGVQKMVMNIGRRPTVNTGEERCGVGARGVGVGVRVWSNAAGRCGWTDTMELPKGGSLRSYDYPPSRSFHPHSAPHSVPRSRLHPPSPPGDEAPTVEVHILHDFASEDFRGSHLKVVATSFLRPEMKFDSLGALQKRIKADIGVARSQLDSPELKAWAAHTSFTI